jgi:hypothetical protein
MKRLGISWVTERLSVSQEGHWSVKLAIVTSV